VLDEAQLEAWGQAVGAAVRGPAFFALSGDLGAGKSVLARAIARGAGVSSVMPSPTFNLVYRYQTSDKDVVHMDLYRLDRADQVWELGWADLGLDGEIVLVEWPERAGSLLPADRWDIHLETESQTRRRLSASAHGQVPYLPAPET
jgi:tRNA threonylcarbamoyl adenosine modification protein YjeE